MNTSLRAVAKIVIPPILFDMGKWAKRRLSNSTVEWEAVSDQTSAWNKSDGWAHQSIVDVQLERWARFRCDSRSPNPLSRWPGGGDDVAMHNLVMSFGYAIGRAALGRKALSVLDWGGGLGHYYVYATELFPDLEFEYVVKDHKMFCDAGRQLLPGARFAFEDEASLGRQYDFVFASSSLQYSFDFYSTVRRLAACAGSWFMATRLPCVREHDDFVVVQRPTRHGYETEYPCWFINRTRFIEAVTACGFRLEREFFQTEVPIVSKAPEQCRYTGFLFQRIQS